MANYPTRLSVPDGAGAGASDPRSETSSPITAYNPSAYQDSTLPLGKYYPSNYENRKRQKYRPQMADVPSGSIKSDSQIPTAATARPAPQMSGHSRNESEAKRRLAQYQRDMIAQAAMAACRSYGDLLAARFFLGFFEGFCLPLFSVITSQWFRRAEQPIRVAAWYSTNGLATIAASALSYGLGHIPSDRLESWQM